MNRASKLDEYVLRALENWGIPGLALGILQGGEVVHSQGYGVRELGTCAPIQEDTLFAIASCSKAFTASALGMLVDAGALHWDDPVVRYLPTFALNDPYLTRLVTIRDLLAHRVGLKENPTIETQGLDYSRAEMVRTARYSETTPNFRANASYSNVMYTVAGEIIQAVSGLSWDDFVRERIFKPLGMGNSGTSAFDLLRTSNHSASHISNHHGQLRIDPIDPAGYWTMDNTGPCGAITSSVEDLVPWLLIHLRGRYLGEQLWSDAVTAELHRPQMLVVPEADSPFSLEAYGLGWYITTYCGDRVIWHSGLFRGMFALVGFVPRLDLGILMLGNARDGAGLMDERLMLWLIDSYAGWPAFDWVADAYPRSLQQRRTYADRLAHLAAQRQTGTRTTLPLERYQGIYAASPPDQWQVVERDKGLRLERLRATRPYYARLEHWHHDVFRPHWNDPLPDYAPASFISFHTGIEGIPLGLSMQGPFIKAAYETRYYARVADVSEDYRVVF
jgi:CubicO group peptidase (beta-lactamase class C family)